MHVPSVADTKELNIYSFDKALSQSFVPKIEYDVEKWIYVPDRYEEYRYILGTRGKNPLICIGINPSTAEPDNLDNTLKSGQRISMHNGYDSFIMFNVYAQRATNPDDMEKNLNELLHAENMKAFEYVLKQIKSGGKSPSVWASWGAIIEKRDYLFGCLSDMAKIGKKYGASWYSSGKISKKGHPHHPLYLPKDSKIDLFDIDAYIKKFSGNL
ncbi:MAG: DUF1643 domain-containing protein [Clostridiales bacterium]|nr:DUF1643 domain-containing protein [Clostridiales bacterium]